MKMLITGNLKELVIETTSNYKNDKELSEDKYIWDVISNFIKEKFNLKLARLSGNDNTVTITYEIDADKPPLVIPKVTVKDDLEIKECQFPDDIQCPQKKSDEGCDAPGVPWYYKTKCPWRGSPE